MPETLYPLVEKPLKIVQTAAIMEVLHAALRLVKSPVATTAIQVASRLAVLWGVAHFSAQGQQHWAFSLMVASWGLVEVPRYLFYAVSDNTEPPAFMVWIRYSLFLILYPTGITGEIGTILSSLADIKADPKLSYPLPNPYNAVFDLHTVLLFTLVLYIPGSYIMVRRSAEGREEERKRRKRGHWGRASNRVRRADLERSPTLPLSRPVRVFPHPRSTRTCSSSGRASSTRRRTRRTPRRRTEAIRRRKRRWNGSGGTDGALSLPRSFSILVLSRARAPSHPSRWSPHSSWGAVCQWGAVCE